MMNASIQKCKNIKIYFIFYNVLKPKVSIYLHYWSYNKLINYISTHTAAGE